MRLVCPTCGAIASAEAWLNDPAMRQVLDIISRLPSAVAIRALPYLGLFRKGSKRVVAWPTAVKLANDLEHLVNSGKVQWDGGEERPAPPDLWARVMDQMLAAHKDGQKNHNYLRSAVWGEAAGLAAQAEREGETKIRHARFLVDGEAGPKEPAKKPRHCFTCGHFKPPRFCKNGNKPVGGDLMRGCGESWTEKPAAVSDLMTGIVAGLQKGEEH